MSLFIGILFFFQFEQGSAQQFTFQGYLVDTIKISSNWSYYTFDSCGTTKGVHDEFVIVFNSNKKAYSIDSYSRNRYRYQIKPDTSIVNSKVKRNKKRIKQEDVQNLLMQFEMTYKKPFFDNLGISRSEFDKFSSKRNILRIAKRHQVDWHFKRKYATREQNKEFFKGCQNRDTFNLFLSLAFDTSGYVLVFDADQSIDVVIFAGEEKHHFEGKYPNTFKQPWYYLTGDVLSDFSFRLNLGINDALVNILPRKFSLFSLLTRKTLVNEYIEWYLKRRGVIYSP